MAALTARGPLEDVRSKLEEVRDFGLRWITEATLTNTLAGDRMRAASAAVEEALKQVGLALDTID